MKVIVSVYNKPPDITKNVYPELLKLFRDYMKNDNAYPYVHQNEAFNTIQSNKEVILVAGTASGKTLAATVPLMWKVTKKEINKVIFMYPTLALLEDQKRVLLKLASLTGLDNEVGYIFGGLHRTELIKNLNKKIIVSTPDAIYWFFQKNIKYSSLLIYGLCLTDEFVLDEAHLFSGLMLQNIQHLFSRVNALREIFLHKAKSKLHLLTATFEEGLAGLNSGIKINGKSKCGTVKVNFIQKTDLYTSFQDFSSSIEQAIENNYNRILVVSNSARNSHKLFEDSKNKKIDIKNLNSAHIFKFGTIKMSDILEIFEKIDINSENINNILSIIIPREGICLKDFPSRLRGYIYIDELIDLLSKEIERAARTISRIFEQQTEFTIREIENIISGNNITIKTFFEAFRAKNNLSIDQKITFTSYEEWISKIIGNIENIQIENNITGTKKEIEKRLKDFITETFYHKKLQDLIFEKLQINLFIKLPSLNELSKKEISILKKRIPLKFLEIEQDVKDKVYKAIINGHYDVNTRYIKNWHNSNVPVILYTGSMTKSARAGLIELFSDVKIPRAILISTSAVEVGVDFDAEVLITELCEGNSFLQRFGRVGRTGKESLVLVLVDGDNYGKLKDKFKIYEAEPLSREDFSSIIKEIFPKRIYATESTFLDSIHLLISEEIGRIGKTIRTRLKNTKAEDLAEKIKSYNIKFSYGLRGTLPAISLKEGITKDPFYLLRYIEEEKLYSSTSPFEIARADHYFTELLYKKICWEKIFVDIDKSREEANWLLYIWKDQVEIAKMQDYNMVMNKLNELWKLNEENYTKHKKILLSNWNKYSTRNEPLCQSIYKLKHWNNIILENKNNILLLYGNIYLKRDSQVGFKPENIQDHFQNPLVITSQIYLIIFNKDKKEIRKLLKTAGVYGLEEIYEDWDGIEYSSIPVFVMLEKVSGACFYVYKKLLEYIEN